MVESITIYIEVCLLERKKKYNRYLIIISDRKNNLFDIYFFNGNIEDAKMMAELRLKSVKKEYKYNEEEKTIRCLR